VPVAFDTSGMEQYDERTWFDPRTGDQVSMTYIGMVPDLPAGLDELPQLRHRLAHETAEVGALIEAHVVFIDTVPTLFQLLKVPIPNQESGQAFIAAFTVPKENCSVVLRIQCAEGATTGAREAAVFAQIGADVRPHPYAPEVKGLLPWHVADDAQWDGQFPDHPLSRARAWAHRTMATARIDPAFAHLPPFRAGGTEKFPPVEVNSSERAGQGPWIAPPADPGPPSQPQARPSPRPRPGGEPRLRAVPPLEERPAVWQVPPDDPAPEPVRNGRRRADVGMDDAGPAMTRLGAVDPIGPDLGLVRSVPDPEFDDRGAGFDFLSPAPPVADLGVAAGEHRDVPPASTEPSGTSPAADFRASAGLDTAGAATHHGSGQPAPPPGFEPADPDLGPTPRGFTAPPDSTGLDPTPLSSSSGQDSSATGLGPTPLPAHHSGRTGLDPTLRGPAPEDPAFTALTPPDAAPTGFGPTSPDPATTHDGPAPTALTSTPPDFAPARHDSSPPGLDSTPFSSTSAPDSGFDPTSHGPTPTPLSTTTPAHDSNATDLDQAPHRPTPTHHESSPTGLDPALPGPPPARQESSPTGFDQTLHGSAFTPPDTAPAQPDPSPTEPPDSAPAHHDVTPSGPDPTPRGPATTPDATNHTALTPTPPFLTTQHDPLHPATDPTPRGPTITDTSTELDGPTPTNLDEPEPTYPGVTPRGLTNPRHAPSHAAPDPAITSTPTEPGDVTPTNLHHATPHEPTSLDTPGRTAPTAAPVAVASPVAPGDVMHTVLVGLPIGGYLPLWQTNEITYWRMTDPEVVGNRLGVGLESRSEVGNHRFREAAMLSPDKYTLFLMDRFRDRTGNLGGTTTQLVPATEEEALAAADDEAMSELYQWLGEVVLAAGERDEFVAVEAGGWHVAPKPMVLITLRTDGEEWHSVVETSPVPVGAPVWRDKQPVDGDTQLLVSPATDQTLRAAGLLTRFAVGTWPLHPFRLGLTFGPNPTLGEMSTR
jgi:hypothetical protein